MDEILRLTPQNDILGQPPCRAPTTLVGGETPPLQSGTITHLSQHYGTVEEIVVQAVVSNENH